ncbi:MAG: chorismate mutase [Spirochaetes bacterium]|uniref:chorismate mutase n=1 Tax=Candidatus Ornithospirochaeta stercoripullorum TaxID=2840899 RepID=A0A9D9H6A8_9SPIO|nr:chorismate mutase [Candidatus Ornithospirochaeta stercoripullorum]
MESNVYALRGATTVLHDSPAEVDEAVGEMMEKLYKDNHLTDEDVAFILFSQTRDIRTRNAAAACRKSGYGLLTPLFCVQEAEIAGGLPLAIRVMVLVNHSAKTEARMAYMRKAASLRPEYKKEENDD